MKGNRKAVIDVVRDAIARGASTVEEVVKSVSDMPLKKLGKLDPTKRLRKVQNESIGTVGEAIRDINEQVRAFAAAPARELVQHRHLRGGLQRMAQRQQVAGGGKSNAVRRRGHRGQQHQRLGDGVGPEMVLGQPERFVAELFGEQRLARERLGAAGERELPRGAAKVKVIHFRTTIRAAAGTRAPLPSMRGRG